MTIRKLTQDEKFSTSAVVDPTATASVSINFAVRANESSGDRFAVSTVLDFSTCSPADILMLATRSAIIDLQRQWRLAANKDLKGATGGYPAKIDVNASIVADQPRAASNPVSKARTAIDKMTPEQREAMLAELMTMVKGADLAPTAKPNKKAA